MNIALLQQWLAEGKTDRVLAELLREATSIDPDLRHEITLLSARFETLSRAKRAGTLDFNDEKLERAAINDALLDLLKRLEKQPRRGVFSHPMAKWGGILVASVGLLAGVAQISGFSLRDFFSKPEQPVADTHPATKRDSASLPQQTRPPTPLKGEPPAQSLPTSGGREAGARPSADTALTLACKTNKGRVNVHFKSGETMRFYAKASRACYLRCIYHLADGRLVLLDNDRPVSAAEAGQWLEIGPGFEVAEPFGDERVYVFAQTAAFPPLRTSTEVDGYLFITEGLPDALRKTRGFKRKRAFAEADVMLRTSL